MTRSGLKIRYLSSGGLITNYYCSSSCKHCLYRCSPKWKKEFINDETTNNSLKIIKKLQCNSIHIGGGEPLLNPSGVYSVLKIAKNLGINIDYIETNSSWFKDLSSACEILQKIYHLGCYTLLISISPFHNEYIPFYKVKGVINACHNIGISVFPWVQSFVSDLNSFDDKTTHDLDEYVTKFGKDYIKNIPNRYWISLGGRALETFSKYNTSIKLDDLLEKSAGCLELAQVSHFHIDLFGNYIPGLCAGLSIQAEDILNEITKEKYPIISYLYSDGIKGLFNFAKEKFNYKPLKQSYFSKCELCYEIRKYLVIDKNYNSIELQPKEHYYD